MSKAFPTSQALLFPYSSLNYDGGAVPALVQVGLPPFVRVIQDAMSPPVSSSITLLKYRPSISGQTAPVLLLHSNTRSSFNLR